MMARAPSSTVVRKDGLASAPALLPLLALIALLAASTHAVPLTEHVDPRPPAPAHATTVPRTDPRMHATFSQTSFNVLNSETGPGNVLPNFMFMAGADEGGDLDIRIGGGRGTPLPFLPMDDADDDIWEGANPDLRSPQLPWLVRDRWDCSRTNTSIPALQLQSESLRAVITPQFGGKIWSLYDIKNKRDMFYNNRAHQPANIGARKAWVSGGCEWNWSPGIIGHSAFTEESVWTAQLDTPYGPVVRVYEFDRYNGTVWQVDMLVSNDTLFTHAKVTNPTPIDLRGYWWTCVAHHTDPSCRIVTPAAKVAVGSALGETTAYDSDTNLWNKFSTIDANFSFTGLDGSWKHDNSYIGNVVEPNDFFARILAPQQPYIAHVESDGYTVIHVHPLNGTKFFTWGQNGPGRFWQDFLAGEDGLSAANNTRVGDYTELQIGPAPTQMQTFPMPANSSLEWTDYFQAWKADKSAMHSKNYADALNEANKWLTKGGGVPKGEYETMDAFFKKLADQPVQQSQIVSPGLPWGGLEARLHAILAGQSSTAPLTPGTLFLITPSDEAQPWIDLVGGTNETLPAQVGTFSAASLARMPLSYQTTLPWITALTQSCQAYECTWLHHLHLGVALAEAGGVAEPIQHFQTSIALRADNPIAWRCLAVLQSDVQAATQNFMNAWALALNSTDPAKDRLVTDLAAEIVVFLSTVLSPSDPQLASFLASVPEGAARGLDQYLIVQMQTMLSAGGQYDAVMSILAGNCFPTIAAERPVLQKLWYSAQEQKQAATLGRALTPIEARNVRVANPPPRNIGCQFGAMYCREYW